MSLYEADYLSNSHLIYDIRVNQGYNNMQNFSEKLVKRRCR